MEGIILITALVSVATTAWFFLKVTAHVCMADPLYGVKIFAFGLGSAFVGYLFKGQVEIKIVLWGVGGVILYALYKNIHTDKR